MKLRIILLLILSALLAPARAGEAITVPAPSAELLPDAATQPPPKPPTILPGREGYAFAKPEVLVRQRLFGLAHGVSLLTAACLDLPAQAQPVQAAYVAWHARHAQAIETIVHDLTGYYFGAQIAAAQWPDLVRALNLKLTIDTALSQFELSAACITLPQALEGTRYDLTALLQADPVAAMTTLSGIPAATSAAKGAPGAPGVPGAPAKLASPGAPAPLIHESPASHEPIPNR